MKSVNLQDLLNDGFSKKFATYYLNIRESELKNSVFEKDFVEWSYANGFTAESASIIGITDQNKHLYLTDYDYYKSWPLNSWSRIWINDKLTLKYALSCGKFDKYMPKYYFYTTNTCIKNLMDNDEKNDFLSTLKQVGIFACKPCNGTQSAGFYKLSYENGNFFINNKISTEKEIEDFINSHSNYVFTEYLEPSEQFEKYGKTIHTLRVIVLNTNGNNPKIVGGYLRLPCEESICSNYILHDGTNNDKYNLWVSVNFETGEYGDGVITYPNKSIKVDSHPSTGENLSGKIENFQEVINASLNISKWFSNLEWIGFDFGITTNGIKIMEINSHPGINIPQIYQPFYEDKDVKMYFESKLKSIDMLSENDKQIRNNILR